MKDEPTGEARTPPRARDLLLVRLLALVPVAIPLDPGAVELDDDLGDRGRSGLKRENRKAALLPPCYHSTPNHPDPGENVVSPDLRVSV